MAGGRPRKYNTAEELQEAIDAYFEETKDVTITGLALFLGFESRQSLYDYAEQEQFSYIIKRAKFKVEHAYELRLINSSSPTGAIFALKNMGWKDKTEREITTPQGITVNYNTQPGNLPLNDD